MNLQISCASMGRRKRLFMNERDFAQRVRDCRDSLWRVSYAILQNGADCDDAMQEALLRAWRQIGSLRDERYFSTWLIRILINESRRMLKQRIKRPQALPESVAAADNDHHALHDCVCALPLNLRIPLVLHYMEGYPVKEIAAMLQLPPTTVQWRLHSARKQIRDQWN